jgi:hemerythrin-like domain-containing protein
MARTESGKSEDAIAMLEADHQKVRDLFEEYRAAEGEERKDIAERVFRELEIHAQLEEDIFYPAVASKGDDAQKKRVATARREHEKVKRLIGELRKLAPNDDRYDAKFQELMESVEQHVEEEEGELFAEAESELGDDAEALGARMEESRKQINAQP